MIGPVGISFALVEHVEPATVDVSIEAQHVTLLGLHAWSDEFVGIAVGMRSPRLLGTAHAHHGHHVHTATLGHQPAGGFPTYWQFWGFAFLDLVFLLKVLRPRVLVGDVGREINHLRGYLTVCRGKHECCLMSAQSIGVKVECHVNGD